MRKYLPAAVYATALLFGAVSADAVLSAAHAQYGDAASYRTFHRELARYGDWVYSSRWGEVWIPDDVSDDFHPYGTDGYWVNTEEYGWYWESDYPWGDIAFHYGRWVNDPDDGWLWIPGYVWSPAWVVWRRNDSYVGWMPMPPDDEFLGYEPDRGTSLAVSIGGLSVRFNSTSDDYGYSRWYGHDYDRDRFADNWVFVGTRHVADRDFRRYRAPRDNYRTLVRNTTNITNYTVVNNYVVNRGVDPRTVRQAGGNWQAVRASNAIKRRQFIARADVGRQLQENARDQRPHGRGFANSAPKPSQEVVQSLSTKVPARGGKARTNLYTKQTVESAPLSAEAAKQKRLNDAYQKSRQDKADAETAKQKRLNDAYQQSRQDEADKQKRLNDAYQQSRQEKADAEAAKQKRLNDAYQQSRQEEADKQKRLNDAYQQSRKDKADAAAAAAAAEKAKQERQNDAYQQSRQDKADAEAAKQKRLNDAYQQSRQEKADEDAAAAAKQKRLNDAYQKARKEKAEKKKPN